MADDKIEETVVEEPAVEVTADAAAPAAEVAAPPEKTPAPAPAAAPSAQEIAAAVAGAIRPGLSEDQIEQQWVRLESEWGVGRQTIMKMNEHAESVALARSLPFAEEAGSARAEKVLGSLSADLLDKVRERMKNLPPAVRSNPVAWEEAAYMVKGRHGDSVKPKAPASGGTREPGKILGGDKVNPGLSERSGGGAPKGGKVKKIEDYSEHEQRIIDRMCGGDVAAYEQYRSKDSTKSGRVIPKVEGGNRADQALANMTKGRGD